MKDGGIVSRRARMLETQAVRKNLSRTTPGIRLCQLGQNCRSSTQSIIWLRPEPTSSSLPTAQHYRPILLYAEQGFTNQYRAAQRGKVLYERQAQYKKKACSTTKKLSKAARTGSVKQKRQQGRVRHMFTDSRGHLKVT